MAGYDEAGRRKEVQPYLVATTKLLQDWSANRVLPHISGPWLAELLDDERFAGTDPMVKVRLLLAALVAVSNQQQPAAAPAQQSSSSGGGSSSEAAAEQLHAALAKLQLAAAGDADEWVKVMAAAAGQLDGRLDLEAVMRQSAVVHETMTGLRQQVAVSTNQHLLPPLEELYLSTTPSVLDPSSGHFSVRPNPLVQPLSTGVSYSAATPPPPSLRATGHQPGSAMRPPQQQHKLPPLDRRSSGLARSLSGVPGKLGGAKPQAVRVLDEAEQQELAQMMRDMTDSNKKEHPRVRDNAKLVLGLQSKHGFAAHVRHEQVQPQPHRQPRTSETGDDAAAAAEQQQPPLLRSQASVDAAAGSGGSSPPALGGAPGGRTVSAELAAEIDELFDDDDDDGDAEGGEAGGLAHTAATGGSRSARGLQHTPQQQQQLLQQQDEDGGGAMPQELEDDMDVEQDGSAGAAGGGTADVGAEDGGGMEATRGSSDGGGQQAQAAAGRAQQLAAKRRRVIDEDDDD